MRREEWRGGEEGRGREGIPTFDLTSIVQFLDLFNPNPFSSTWSM